MQHNQHLILWLKAKFNITIAQSLFGIADNRYHAYEGDYDLDIQEASGPTIFDAALEYSACYDAALNDKLVNIEMGVGLDV